MKTAMDYARQALRFAERVCNDVDALRADWKRAMKEGQRHALDKGVPHCRDTQAFIARADARMAAHHARKARGMARYENASMALYYACGAAWRAGFAST